MTKSHEHQNKIIDLLTRCGSKGVNSRVLITEITPRWSARKRELVKEGFKFHTRRETIGGSNLIRIWMDYNPRTGKTLPSNKPIRYEFDKERQVFIAIY